MKKYSFLGMALLATSAITAAFMPSSAKSSSGDELNGFLHPDPFVVDNDLTCTNLDEGQCSYTVTTATPGTVQQAGVSETLQFSDTQLQSVYTEPDGTTLNES
ncbi:hypothetical protein GFS24_21355 [Chitinophaga sp. SYP-B3965]|uniref:hypothetical protein n=1 Tax=Chitinophaga sp. SYP-B3965 TaxID=2663120 RepID=UPI0012998EB1|nr:hypothetical protein [Chitinophaga sp. SYP-B3965]MRG47685.1 hypothetical protein [Chitinophaga sp. SYP-B3965]